MNATATPGGGRFARIPQNAGVNGAVSAGALAAVGFAPAPINTAAVEALATNIVVPLRERLERAVADTGGDNEELATIVRGIYREWKTQRIDEHLDDVLRTAFGRGALAAVLPGTKVCWMVDPSGPACPDAEDNALAGEVPAGQPFPTGHVCAPAHEGCRCMLALAPR